MGRIDRRPMQAFLAALLLMCLASPAALAEEILEFPIHDPKDHEPGSLLAGANVLLTESESRNTDNIRKLREAIRDKLDEQERNAPRNEAEIFVLSWDTIVTALLARDAVQKFAGKFPQQHQQSVRELEPVIALRSENGIQTEMPASLGFMFGIENLSRADGRLRAVTGRLELPKRVTLRGQGDCSLAEGTFDVTRQGHLIELSTDAYAAYFGTTSDKELWLHLNEERWASATLGEEVGILAPMNPGQLLVLTPEGQGFVGTQRQKPDCRVEIRPSGL